MNGLTTGRIVRYCDGRPAIVTRVADPEQGLVELTVFGHHPYPAETKGEVAFDPEGQAPNSWRWTPDATEPVQHTSDSAPTSTPQIEAI